MNLTAKRDWQLKWSFSNQFWYCRLLLFPLALFGYRSGIQRSGNCLPFEIPILHPLCRRSIEKSTVIAFLKFGFRFGLRLLLSLFPLFLPRPLVVDAMVFFGSDSCLFSSEKLFWWYLANNLGSDKHRLSSLSPSLLVFLNAVCFCIVHIYIFWVNCGFIGSDRLLVCSFVFYKYSLVHILMIFWAAGELVRV